MIWEQGLLKFILEAGAVHNQEFMIPTVHAGQRISSGKITVAGKAVGTTAKLLSGQGGPEMGLADVKKQFAEQGWDLKILEFEQSS